jgi:uncharacterized protein DUF6624
VKILAFVGIALFWQVVRADEFSRVTADLAAYDAHVAGLEAQFAKRPADLNEKNWVRMKLAHMVNIDQYLRQYSMLPVTQGYSDAERLDFNRRFMQSRWQSVDTRNTADLKQLLAIHGWFKISSFGDEADNNAWLLVQHADQDRDFQRHVLSILEPLVAQHETRPEHYAYLFDRLAALHGDAGGQQPQRYGTQGRCVGKGKWEPFEVEEPARLDERRASVGLMPEAEYQKQFVNLCVESDEETLRKTKAAAGQSAAQAP